MAEVAFGVWDGVVHDAQNGKIPPDSPLSDLKKFDEFDDGNSIRAFSATAVSSFSTTKSA